MEVTHLRARNFSQSIGIASLLFRVSPYRKVSPSFTQRILAAFLIYLIGGFPALAYASPTGRNIVSGSGTITDDGSGNLTINQTSDKLIIDWNSFSIDASQSVTFVQPNTNSQAVSNVLGLDPSIIAGALIANGQVFLVNTNGIIVQPTANIDVGALIMSTLKISNQDFLNDLYKFTQDTDKMVGLILNEGTIRASDFAAMIAPAIQNKGVVVASLGGVGMASGEEVTLDFIGDGLINFTINQAVEGTVLDSDGNVIDDRIHNSGTIQANGGTVLLTALNASDIIKNVVNNEGMIEANTVVKKDGKILLMGGDQGIVRVSGTLDASGDDSGEKGGTVHVLGEKVALSKGGVVNVSGDAGGGEALIGGDYQGGNSMIQNAWRTYIDKDAVINAGALTDGDGGKVVVWADDVNRFYGNIHSTGGTTGGDGGFAEVSGKNFLDFKGNVDLASYYGELGTLLLDPKNVTIVNDGSVEDVADVEEFGDSANSNSTIDASVLDDEGTNIQIQASSDIKVNEAINLTTSGATLTLQAGRSILINKNITTNNAALTLTANEISANGVVDARRASGAAVITMKSSGPGTTINTGSGTFTATINAGTGNTTRTSGDITLDNVTAGSLVVTNKGPTPGSDILGNVGGVLTIAGTSSFTTSVSNADITLNSVNAMTGAVTLSTTGSSGNALIHNGTTELDIATSSVGGDLTLLSSGTIGLGNSNCKSSCGMTISGSDLQNITATNLNIGNSTTGKIYVGKVSAGNTQNISSTVTLTSSSDISFHKNNSTFRTLTLTADRDISLEKNVETTVGDFDATADADNNTIGIFTLDTGVTLTSEGNVTIEADKIEDFGTINATGTETLTGQVVTSDALQTARRKEEINDAFEQAFVRDLFEIAKSGC